MKNNSLKIHDKDNILVVIAELKQGDKIICDEIHFEAPRNFAIGDKLTLTALKEGDKIVKHGLPIGSATCAIAAGEWVHLHNMKSDYIPTYIPEKVPS